MLTAVDSSSLRPTILSVRRSIPSHLLMATKETRRGGEGKLVLPSSLSHSPLGICIEFRKKGFPPSSQAAAAGAARSTEEGREECALCKTRDYSHRTLSQSFSPSGWHHWHGGGHRKARRRRRTQQPAHPFLSPSLPSLSLERLRRRVVSVFSAAANVHTTRRHSRPSADLPSVPQSLALLLCWRYASGRASERASGEREVIRKSCPSGTNSIRQPPPPPRSNNRQFMRRAPLLFTPQQRRRRSPMSASSVRPSLRLAMHEESDEIPLLLFLFFFVSLHHDDARKTVERAKKRRNERTNAETLSSLPFTVASRYT